MKEVNQKEENKKEEKEKEEKEKEGKKRRVGESRGDRQVNIFEHKIEREIRKEKIS